tara:strand:- start:343 stop:711 length:369 start_codon:yes stop_codon:yes gene_type:complete
MGQRVTLTYSVDLDDLESEVRRLFDKGLSTLHNNYENHLNLSQPMLEASTLDEIDNLRRTLNEVDMVLGDVSEIIRSYLQYKFQITPTPAPALPLDEALSQIQTLTEQLSDESNTPQKDGAP